MVHKFNYSYSNLHLAYKYILALACTQVNCERAFTKLKIVKNLLRSAMSQHLLDSLLLKSAETDMLPDHKSVIDTLAVLSQVFRNLLT